jgi:hypothetical protein
MLRHHEPPKQGEVKGLSYTTVRPSRKAPNGTIASFVLWRGLEFPGVIKSAGVRGRERIQVLVGAAGKRREVVLEEAAR